MNFICSEANKHEFCKSCQHTEPHPPVNRAYITWKGSEILTREVLLENCATVPRGADPICRLQIEKDGSRLAVRCISVVEKSADDPIYTEILTQLEAVISNPDEY